MASDPSPCIAPVKCPHSCRITFHQELCAAPKRLASTYVVNVSWFVNATSSDSAASTIRLHIGTRRLVMILRAIRAWCIVIAWHTPLNTKNKHQKRKNRISSFFFLFSIKREKKTQNTFFFRWVTTKKLSRKHGRAPNARTASSNTWVSTRTDEWNTGHQSLTAFIVMKNSQRTPHGTATTTMPFLANDPNNARSVLVLLNLLLLLLLLRVLTLVTKKDKHRKHNRIEKK